MSNIYYSYTCTLVRKCMCIANAHSAFSMSTHFRMSLINVTLVCHMFIKQSCVRGDRDSKHNTGQTSIYSEMISALVKEYMFL